MNDFLTMELLPELLKAIEDLNVEKPMPVQAEVVPKLLKEKTRDMIVLAQTGTGKTAAYGLPLLQSLDLKSRKTQILIFRILQVP
jgi:ATP-dependent RNA helicase DeaD